MEGTLQFDYYYGAEADQFRFFRIPKILFEKSCFKALSCESKLLYGLMLDHMSLSLKNGWVDKENRTYIIFTVNSVSENLGCSKDKARKLVKELEDIGLIERKKRGQGKPDVIYVKNFVTLKTEKPFSEKGQESTEDFSESGKTGFQKAENPLPRGRKNRFLEDGKTAPNDTDNNKTNISDIHPILSDSGGDAAGDWEDRMEADIALIKKNIHYDDCMKIKPDNEKELFEELFRVIVDVVVGRRESIAIGDTEYPQSLVRSRFLKLDTSHLEYAMAKIAEHRGAIRNMRGYMVAALYHAPTTMKMYYTQRVCHDMHSDSTQQAADIGDASQHICRIGT